MEKIKKELIRKLNENLDCQEELRKKLSSLRNGKVVIKTRNNVGYYYLEYRKGNKVVTDYLGKVFTGEIEKYLNERQQYIDIKFQIDNLILEEKQIKKVLKDLGITNYRTIYSIYEIKKIIKPILKKYKVKKAYLFGSYARGDANKKSDIDFIISNVDSKKLFDFENEVKTIFGKDIDFVYSGDNVTKAFANRVNKERILVYEL